MYDWEFFISVLGCVLFVEGLPYCLMPLRMKRFARQVSSLPGATLRFGGFIAMICGLAVVYLARRGF